MSGLSILVPAHNEQFSLQRCLSALFQQPPGFDMQVVVVANGCTDRTAEVAGRFRARAAPLGIRLDIIEVEAAGKWAALNVGDQHAIHANRAYLDADIVVSLEALREVQGALARGALLVGLRIGVPPLTGRRLTDSYAALWCASPAVTGRVIGAGFYAVHSDGRARWACFPPIISDDKFVRLHFLAHEQYLGSSQIEVTFPTDPRELLAVRGRWARGNRQVAALLPAAAQRDRRPEMLIRTAALVVRRPGLWRHAPAALLVYAAGWWLGRRPVVPGVWERGESSPSRGSDEDVAARTCRAGSRRCRSSHGGRPAGARPWPWRPEGHDPRQRCLEHRPSLPDEDDRLEEVME